MTPKVVLSTDTGLFDRPLTCGTCRFFGEDSTVLVLNEELDYVPTGYHKCLLIEHGNHCQGELQKEPGHGALAQDYSGAYAALIVESDFGCVKWEAK